MTLLAFMLAIDEEYSIKLAYEYAILYSELIV